MADYPFTTLYPNLGVVKVENHRSFVIADIPGLIRRRCGRRRLGAQFLRPPAAHPPAAATWWTSRRWKAGGGHFAGVRVRAIERELEKHDPEREQAALAGADKADLMFEDEAQLRRSKIVAEWAGRSRGSWFPRWAAKVLPDHERIMAFFDRQKEDELEARNAQ